MNATSRFDALRLHGSDNVATALRDLAMGEVVQIGGAGVAFAIEAIEPVRACHKIALGDLKRGAAVIKYGALIGEAITSVAAGSHVHIHNIRSLRARG